jgi:ATP adenylyltransferase/5',5'''-P-1,P-4-tetraphosphate phosphorylase II
LNKSRSTTNKQVLTFLNKNDYANAVKLLLQAQIKEWNKLEEGYKNLSSLKTKTFWFDGFKIKIQFNAERIFSTSAKVDADSIKTRSCFLCEKSLPKEQKGIWLLDNYLLLCNPYPVFPEHFTIVTTNHKPQQISSSFSDFIVLSKLLSDNYTVIYNGPHCGASAPDHIHFQTGTKYFMPIENDFHSIKKEFGDTVFNSKDLTLTAVDDGLRRFISLESTEDEILKKAFNSIYSELDNNNSEPMMNLICNYDKQFGWTVIIFLRSSHRPSHYYLKGEEQIIFSPAAIDLGGVCILPVQKDFDKIGKELLVDIFNEVTVSVNDFDTLKVKLKKKFSGKLL